MKNTTNMFYFILCFVLFLVACNKTPAGENTTQQTASTQEAKANTETISADKTQQNKGKGVDISLPIDWDHIDLSDDDVYAHVLGLCYEPNYNPPKQIPGQPYKLDPCALSSECDRKFHELPAKADAGDATAQNELGHAIMECASVISFWETYEDYFKDPKKKFNLFLSSAKQGNVDSMFMVGWEYLHGSSVPDYPSQDVEQAEKWLAKAAEQGHSVAALGIARIYTEGLLGKEKDPQKARKWANISLKADPENTSANYYLGLLALDEKHYKEAAKLFAACQYTEWWLTNECRHAKYQLSKLYQKGLGVPLDLNKAKQLYEDARPNQGFTPLLPKEDPTKVSKERLWHNAVYENDPASQYELGRRYETGDGVEKDIFHATEWYFRAAQQNYPDALYALAMVWIPYPEGLRYWGCTFDYVPQQYLWLKKAADQGHAKAAYELAQMYKTGVYMEPDMTSNRCVGGGLSSDVIIGKNKEKAKYYFKKSGMKPPKEK